METTDTASQFPKIKQGPYTFMVAKEPLKKKSASGSIFYEFDFEAMSEEKIVSKYRERFMVWMMADLLNAFGFKPVSADKYEWDKAAIVGMKVDADIVYEEDRNDKTKSWPRMKNIVSTLPF